FMLDDPNITMEEYIKLQGEKAQRCPKINMLKSMDGVIYLSKDTNPIKLDENLETNHDDKNEPPKMSKFILIIEVISQITFHERKPLILIIENLYVPFDIPFDPNRFNKDGDYTRNLRRPRFMLDDPNITMEEYIKLQDFLAIVYNDAFTSNDNVSSEPTAWVASRPKRQSIATAGAPEVTEGAPDVDEGAKAITVPYRHLNHLLRPPRLWL
nr:hypothetical protein [Tanacetum cinerariifolium]